VTDSQHPPAHHRPINWPAIGILVTLIPMAASIVAQWAVSTEQRRMAEARDIEQNAAIAALEDRLRAMENNRTIEQRLGELQVAITRVETEVSGMRRDVRGRR
jgi:hypothetical protein